MSLPATKETLPYISITQWKWSTNSAIHV